MTDNEKIDQLAEVFETNDFSAETKLDDLNWDSMGMLTVIAIAKTGGKVVTGAQVRAAQTVGDLLALI